MITEDAQDMKWQLEHLPSKEDLRALASEIRAVQERNFDNYITDNAYPARRSGANVQTSGIADPTAGLAVTGYERFVREKQRDLKRLVTTYRDHQRFTRLACLCFEQMPADEVSMLRNEEDCEHWERVSKRICETSDLAILGVLGGMGLGDAAEVPGPFLKHPQGIRSYAGWLEAHLLFPEYIQAVYELQTEVALKNLELYRQAVGDRIQAIWLSGTDFGMQSGTMHSLSAFQALYEPYYRRVNDWIHKNTTWKTFYHTCGSVESYIPDFIDMGMDILNPVQCSAAGMEAADLKARFGDKIVFWGGGVDTQGVLPMGTPEAVYRQVRERIEIFSPGGGFVFSTIHNIVSGVPVENLLAMYKAVADSRKA